MSLLQRLRARRTRRRAEHARRVLEQAQARREVEAEDHSLAEATHVPPPPGPFTGHF